jgi:hypothetical protein
MLAEDIQHDLLHRCVHERRWRDLTQACFLRRFRDEIAGLDDAVLSTHDAYLPLYRADCTVYHLITGYAVLVAGDNWSLFESIERVKRTEHINAYAAYVRGCWLATPPKAPGYYAVRDRQGNQSYREIKVVNGRLRDVTSREFLPPGVVSTWRGDWWHQPLPRLPD